MLVIRYDSETFVISQSGDVFSTRGNSRDSLPLKSYQTTNEMSSYIVLQAVICSILWKNASRTQKEITNSPNLNLLTLEKNINPPDCDAEAIFSLFSWPISSLLLVIPTLIQHLFSSCLCLQRARALSSLHHHVRRTEKSWPKLKGWLSCEIMICEQEPEVSLDTVCVPFKGMSRVIGSLIAEALNSEFWDACVYI